jgi:antitoxin HigA-1
MSKSSITTTSRRKAAHGRGELLPLVTPGEVLLEEFLKPMALSQNALARAIRVLPRRVNEIVLGLRAITADTDLRLARYFAMSEGFFLGLQADHDLRAKKREMTAELAAIRPKAA